MDRLEYWRSAQSKRRSIARRKGLCIRCCVRKARKGKTECQQCVEYSRDWNRKKFSNVNIREVEKRRKIQKNKCAICKKEFNETPQADHDHKTKTFRGLLCSRCNKALGLFLESVRIMSNAIKYVRKHKRRKV